MKAKLLPQKMLKKCLQTSELRRFKSFYFLSWVFLMTIGWSFGMGPGVDNPVESKTSKSSTAKMSGDQTPPTANCKDVSVQLSPSGTATIIGPSYSIPFFTEQFTSDPIASNQTTDLVNWTLISGSVDVGNYVAAMPGRTVDMEGDNNGIIETKNNLEFYPGTYQITFQHQNNNAGSNNSLRVSLGTFVADTFVAPSSLQTATMTFTVTSNMQMKLRFQQLGPEDRSGNFIGDIKVARVYDNSFLIDNGSFDNTQLAGLSVSQANFTCADVGNNTVTLTATDAHGNISTCTANVLVIDPFEPEVKTRNISVQLDANGQASIVPTDVDNGSTDNCVIASRSLDRSNFDCNDLFQTTSISRVSDSDWKQSTVELTTPNPRVSVAGQLPADNTYTLGVQNVWPYNGTGVFSPSIPGTSPIYSDGGTKFYKTNFNLTGQPVSLRIRARVDNYMEIFVNGHSIGFERDRSVLNFNNTVYHDIFIDANGVQNGFNGGMQFDVVTTQDILSLLQAGDNELVFAIGNENGTDEGGFTVRLDAVAGGVPVLLTVNDLSGNSDTDTAYVLVEDNLAPVLTCPADMVVPTDPNSCSAVVNYTVGHQDNCSSTIIYSHASGSVFPLGTTTVTATAEDQSGNVSTCSFNITVEDTEPPVYTCPSDITVNATDANGTVVNYSTPSATDNCGLSSSSLTAGFASGSTFPIGTTTVTYTAEDNSGNTANCSFDVTVSGVAPVVECPGNIVVSTDANQCGASVTFAAVDNTGNPASTITYSHAPGSFFPIGATTVTATATNSVGSSSCSFVVNVSDDEAPILNCPADIVLNNQTDECGANAQFVATATDNCQVSHIDYSHSSGSFFAVGSTTVTVTATDVSGNSIQCTFTVTVNDTQDPEFQALVGNPFPTNTASQPGVFTKQGNALHGGSPYFEQMMAHADFDGDGDEDLVYALNGNSPSVWLNDGLGVMTAGFQTGGTQPANAVTAADVNGDGSPDIVYAFWGNQSTGQSKVYLNDGQGNFTLSQSNVGGPDRVNDVKVADLNGDGHADLYFVGSGYNNRSDRVWFGNGTGQFTASTQLFNVNAWGTQMAMADFDNDGDLDVFTASDFPANQSSMWLNDGTGHFVQGASGMINGYHPRAEDYDGDGDLDLVYAGGSNTGNINVYLNDGSANFTLSSDVYSSSPGNYSASSVEFGDIDNDGDRDMVIAYNGTNTANSPRIYLNDGANNYSSSTNIPLQYVYGMRNFALLDMDNDGDLDFANANYGWFNEVLFNQVTHPSAGGCEDIVQTADAGQCGANVQFDYAAADNCPGVNTVYSQNPGTFFPVGTTTVTATATDAAGNQSTCQFDVTVTDDEAPVLACPPGVNGATQPGTCSAVVNFAVQHSDNCSSTVTYSHPPGSSFPLGVTTVTATATDPSGNTTSCNFTVNVVDYEAPTISCNPDITEFATSANGAVVNYNTPVGSDNCSVASVDLIDGLPSGSTFPIGTTQVLYQVVDGSGNAASCSFAVTVEGIAPEIVCPADMQVNSDAGQCGAVVQFAATDEVGIPASTISYSHAPGSFFPVGTTTVTATATNAVGTSTCSFDITVIDNEAPVVTCPADITVNNDAGVCGAAVSFDASSTDNCSSTLSYSHASGSEFPVGTTTVTVTATDPAGNSSSCSFDVTVIDNEAPVVTCPADITVNNDAGVCGAAVSFDASSTDNCSSTLSYSHASGSVFPVGTTTVTVTATDPAGNSSSCSFDVTVIDNEAPVVTCPADITVNNDAGVCGAAVSFDASSTDNCSSTLSYSHASGYEFPVGTTTVTVSATDPAGNSSTCSFDVTVIDNETPVVSTQNTSVTLVNGSASITPNDVDNGSADNCSIASLSLDQDSWTCSDIGQQTVVLTATDIHGNQQSATAIVTVNGEVPSCSITSMPTSNEFTGGNDEVLYIGYGAQSTVLQVSANGGGQFSYSWTGTGLDCYSCANPEFTPNGPGLYDFEVTVTNECGCETTCQITICVFDVRSVDKKGRVSNKKVDICHIPPGNPGNAHTISVSTNAVQAHLNHGCQLGDCNKGECGSLPGKSNITSDEVVEGDHMHIHLHGTPELNAYPNPSFGEFKIQLTSENDDAVVWNLMDAKGKVIRSGVAAANQEFVIDADIAFGVYMLEVHQGAFQKTVRLIKN